VSDLTDADRALLERAAEAVVRRRLAVPTMMFLEMVAPMNLVAATMLRMLAPVWSVALPGQPERLGDLLERREAVPELIAAIDAAESRRRDEERAARGPRRRWPWSRRAPPAPPSPVGAAPGADPDRPEDPT